jgi:LysM repeat protein
VTIGVTPGRIRAVTAGLATVGVVAGGSAWLFAPQKDHGMGTVGRGVAGASLGALLGVGVSLLGSRIGAGDSAFAAARRIGLMAVFGGTLGLLPTHDAVAGVTLDSGGGGPRLQTYDVKPGDTMWDIAAAHGITLDALINANNVTDPSYLVPGTRLAIPPASAPDDPAPAAPPVDTPSAPDAPVTWPTVRELAARGWPTAESQSRHLDQVDNVRIVAKVAHDMDVNATLAVAMMLAESNGNNRAVGDDHSSFGLFQLHKGGLLTDAKLTRDQAFDPLANATVAIASLTRYVHDDPYRDFGELAAASQKPENPTAYAERVDDLLDDADKLLHRAGVST